VCNSSSFLRRKEEKNKLRHSKYRYWSALEPYKLKHYLQTRLPSQQPQILPGPMTDTTDQPGLGYLQKRKKEERKKTPESRTPNSKSLCLGKSDLSFFFLLCPTSSLEPAQEGEGGKEGGKNGNLRGKPRKYFTTIMMCTISGSSSSTYLENLSYSILESVSRELD